MKKSALAFAALVLLLLGYGAYTRLNADETGEPRYRTETLAKGPIIASVSATGTVTPTTTVIVGSQLSGQVVEILADYNTEVKAGQVLARLNRDTLSARYDGAKADLAQARASRALNDSQVEKTRSELARATTLLVDAEKTYQRQRELKSRGVATDVTLQAATTARDTQASIVAGLNADLKLIESQKLASDAQIAKAQATVRQIEVDLSNADIRAPVDGVVIKRDVELGQTVAASLQSPTLFLVAQDLRRIEIYANVDEADVGRVKPEQQVDFTVTAYPGRNFSGRIKQIRLGSQTISNVVIYTAIVEVANDDLALMPGMTANLRIFTERKGEVLRLPNAALRWAPPGTPREGPGAAMPQPAGGGDMQGRNLLETLKTELALTPAQVTEAEKLGAAMRAEIAAATEASARREVARAARQRFSKAFSEILTEDQRAKYKTLQENRQNARARGNEGVPGRVHRLDAKGQPQAVPVRLGASDGNFTEVLSGEIKAGDIVITGASGGKPAPRTAPAGGMRFGL